MKKYELVVFGDEWDVYQTAHRDWIDNPRVTYIASFRPQGLLGWIQRIQFNPRLNSVVSVPLKHKWCSCYLRGVNAKNACFLITERWLRMECGIRLLPYLRQHYPDSRIVCFTQDLIDTIIDHYSNRPIDVEYIKQYADLFISYDPVDAAKHHVKYHPTVYSPIQVSDVSEVYDLYFLGRDKGRLKTLVRICTEARRRGLCCLFLLLEVPEQQQIACEGIVYVDHPVAYQENLRYVAESRCVVELLQQEASSPTFRTWETIMLNKVLLTNNASIRKTAFYDARYISVFHDETDVDWESIVRGMAFPDGQNPFKDEISPQSLIAFIENELQIQIAL